MTCPTCEPIGSGLSANTGRDEYLPKDAYVLVAIYGGDSDIRKCPGCGDLFWYESEHAQTGSGNNDCDSVTRMSQADSQVVSALLLRGEIADPFQLSWQWRDFVLERLSDDQLRQLLPRIVGQVLADSSPSYVLNSTVYKLASEPACAAQILDMLGERTDERLRYLRARCVETSATTSQS